MADKLNSVSIIKAQSILEAVISNAFKNNIIPPNLCLHGPPGVGKSAIVNDLKNTVSERLGISTEDVVIIDIRLSGMEAADVQGVPYVPPGSDIMKFSTPEWFPNNDGKFYILFLDELMNAHQSVQHAAYRLILDRSVQNGTKLPTNCAIVAAGNLRSDKTGAKPLLPAAANRFALHLYIDNIHETIQHMVEVGVDRDIVAFLEYQQDCIFRTPVGDDAAFPTPRTWCFADEHIKNPILNKDDHILTIAIAGCVGTVAATEFMAFREYNQFLPSWKRIRSGDKSYTYEVPNNDDALKYAIGVACAYELVDIFENNLYDECDYMVDKVVQHLPDEILIVLFRSLNRNKKAIAKINSFKSAYAMFTRITPHLK